MYLDVVWALLGWGLHELAWLYRHKATEFSVRKCLCHLGMAVILALLWIRLGYPNHYNLFLLGIAAPAVAAHVLAKKPEVPA